MIRHFRSPFVIISFLLIVAGCMKETYDMDKLSGEVYLSPTIGIAAVKGDVSLNDIVKANDTVIYDPDNFVRLVFSEDSLIEKKLTDFYDLEDLVKYTDTYPMGELSISPFSGSMGFTLDQISQKFSPALRSQFVALNDGLNHPFPAFPTTNLGEKGFTAFTNFEYVIFHSGFLDISVKNNLTAPLNSISINLFNATGHTPVGSTLTIPATQPGQTQTVSLDLADKSVTNSLIAAVILSGSPGTTTPVRIDLANSNIQITISGRNLKVKSGRAILPIQVVETLDKKDTIDIDPGDGVEIDQVKAITGNFTYMVQSGCPLRAILDLKLQSTNRSGSPVREFITIPPSTSQSGSISVNNTLFNLGTDPGQPYNRLPVEYNLTVSSEGNMVNFNSADVITLNLNLSNPELDYVKGFFGSNSAQIDPDSVDLGIDEVLDRLTGDFYITSPSIRINYRNSFAVPIELSLAISGSRGSESVNLGLLPILLATPGAPAATDIAGSYTIDKNNSSLPELVSLPPEILRYSGSARMNPLNASNVRNNYIYGNSRFIASMEVEVPLEFRINNLQFTDTVDNFLKDEGNNGDESIGVDDFEMMRIDLDVNNGFPMGVSAALSLYDPVTHQVRSTVNATDIIKPAPVGSNGKATGVTGSETSILISKEFFESVNSSDEIIFRFTLNTTDNGSKNVKIYSDYRIDFRAALVVKPIISLE